MMTLISANWLFYLIALLIGILTAFWVWAASGREDSAVDSFSSGDGLLEKAGEPVRPTAPRPEPVTPEKVVHIPATQPKPSPKQPAPKQPAAPVSVADTAEPAAKPVAEQEEAPSQAGKPNIPQAVGEPDNLRLIKGVGPKLDTLLNKLGVKRFDQIADWKEAEIAEVDQYLENFAGRITRDAWIDQAKFLAKDDIAGFEKKYGKL